MSHYHREVVEQLVPKYWDVLFGDLLDALPTTSTVIQRVKALVLNDATPWYVMLNVLELTVANVPEDIAAQLRTYANEVFTRENAGYRILGNLVAPVTDATEAGSIEDALHATSRYEGANHHLRRALELLSDRDHPDYRNSIKESVSAVESLCKVAVDDGAVTLGKALARLERRQKLHPALKSSFSSLYGYTSDADGIRHAMMEPSAVTFSEAKLLLVTCSAFVNYLVASVLEPHE